MGCWYCIPKCPRSVAPTQGLWSALSVGVGGGLRGPRSSSHLTQGLTSHVSGTLLLEASAMRRLKRVVVGARLPGLESQLCC